MVDDVVAMQAPGPCLQPRRRIDMADAQACKVVRDLGDLIETELLMTLQTVSGARFHTDCVERVWDACRSSRNTATERPAIGHTSPGLNASGFRSSDSLVLITMRQPALRWHSGKQQPA